MRLAALGTLPLFVPALLSAQGSPHTGPPGYVYGTVTDSVRDAASREPLAGGRVVGHTPIVALRDGRLQTNPLEVTAPSGDDGAFFLCGLPPSRSIDLAAVTGADSSGTFTVDLPPTGLLTRDVFVGPATGGVLSGRVVRQEGAPIRGARVVDVLAGGAVELELTLPTVQSVLDTVHVYGQRLSRDRQAYEWRKQMGLGTFLERARIEEMHPVHAAEILREVHAVTVMPGGVLDVGAGRLCLATVVLDGNRIPLVHSIGEIDSWIQPQEVQAMEVYVGANAPAEYFQSGGKPCATILIWTNPTFSLPIPK